MSHKSVSISKDQTVIRSAQREDSKILKNGEIAASSMLFDGGVVF